MHLGKVGRALLRGRSGTRVRRVLRLCEVMHVSKRLCETGRAPVQCRSCTWKRGLLSLCEADRANV